MTSEGWVVYLQLQQKSANDRVKVILAAAGKNPDDLVSHRHELTSNSRSQAGAITSSVWQRPAVTRSDGSGVPPLQEQKAMSATAAEKVRNDPFQEQSLEFTPERFYKSLILF